MSASMTDRRLLSVMAQGYSITEAEGMLQIPASTICKRLISLGAPQYVPAETKWRTCLCCRNGFPSWGPGNRMCKTCREAA